MIGVLLLALLLLNGASTHSFVLQSPLRGDGASRGRASSASTGLSQSVEGEGEEKNNCTRSASSINEDDAGSKGCGVDVAPSVHLQLLNRASTDAAGGHGESNEEARAGGRVEDDGQEREGSTGELFPLMEYRCAGREGQEGATLYCLGDNADHFASFLDHMSESEEAGPRPSEQDDKKMYHDVGSPIHVNVTDDAMREHLMTLWEERRLVVQEGYGLSSATFADLLRSDTKRMKSHHGEHMSQQDLLNYLEEHGAFEVGEEDEEDEDEDQEDKEEEEEKGKGKEKGEVKREGEGWVSGAASDVEVKVRGSGVKGCSSYQGVRSSKGRPSSEGTTIRALRSFLRWFKAHFPYYYDGCLHCGNKEEANTFIGVHRPTEEEQTYQARRVELYRCSRCHAVSRFPRYEAVSKVLQTRRGRCSEYSVLAYRFLEALGHELRWVVDWADHLWVEVRVCGRWVHCDPCEAAVDEPLLYEAWGKQATYIVAFTEREVVDVTSTYTSNMELARTTRDISDAELASLLADNTRQLVEE